jgi:hypothetical protein
MRHVVAWIVIGGFAFASGCGKSADRCERYVDLRAECSGEPVGDRKMAISICRSFDRDTEEDAVHRGSHECAVSSKDCAGFAVCLDGVIAKKEGAPVAAVTEGVGIMLEVTGALTAAVGGKECDAQTQAVKDTLAAQKAKVDRLVELMRDRKTQSAITKSDRSEAAVAAFKKAAQCNPPSEAFAEVFSNIPPPPRPTAVTGPVATAEQCTLAAGMFAEIVVGSSGNEAYSAVVKPALQKRCTTDGWSADAATCYQKLGRGNVDGVPVCDAALTQAQSDALLKDLEAAYATVAPPPQ